MRPQLKANQYQTLAAIIALSLFVAGRFGFFDILGLKRIFEITLFLPITFLGGAFLILLPRNWFQPLFLLPLSYLFLQLYWNPDYLALADLSIATLIVIIIFSLGPKFSDLLLRITINIASFFAVLGIIEFGILILNPSFVSYILLFYDDYSGSNVPMIENPLQFLGLSDGTAYHLFGLAVTRLRSFASEPSLLVGYFLVPGALGLTYTDKYARYGIICIMFALCSLAGSVFAAMFFSALSLFFLSFKGRYTAIILPFLVLLCFIWILNNHYSDLILMAKTLGGDVDFLDKTNSANVRFSYIRDYTPKIFLSPLGLSEEIHQPLGLIVGSAARGGYFGFIVILIILGQFFRKIGFLLGCKHLPQLARFGLYIIYGSLLAGILYLDNCFIQIYGFTLLTLIHHRLNALINQGRPDMIDKHTR